MTESTRVKINICTGEIELEGSESFVTSQIANIPNLLNLMPKQPAIGALKKENINIIDTVQTQADTATDNSLNMSEHFGEWYQRFPKTIQQTEKMLVAGYFQQRNSENNAFETRQANNLLLELGVKLTNPAQCSASLENNKDIFQKEKRGKLSVYRLSEQGIERLKKLIENPDVP
jgi:hypothetical protein